MYLSACPEGTITAVDNGGGSFTFTLNIDYTNSNGVLNAVDWYYGDGTNDFIYPISGSPSTLSQSHTYTTTNSSFTVYAVLHGQIEDVAGNISDCSSTTPSFETQDVSINSPSCPTAVFQTIGDNDWCNTGELYLGWTFCNDDNYWTADYAVWNLSDGQSYTSDLSDNVTINFNSSSTVTITGLAHFIGENGELCTSTIYYSAAANGDACALQNNSLSGTPFIEIDPPYAEPNLYVQLGSFCSNDNISVFDAGGLYNQTSSNWSYELFVNNQSYQTGSGIPSSALLQSSLPPGDHLIELVYTYVLSRDTCSVSDAIVVTVDDCNEGDEPCEICNGFTPEIGKRYWISAWVKEEHPDQVKKYEDAHISIDFIGNSGLFTFYPTGEIIEGWQRIVGSFTIPNATTDIKINLISAEEQDTYFDDIRIHPFNASAKSYVYDPETLLLTAELDDNNYATFYEYDKEGKLIRIKKETSRGIVTIQESRSSNVKQEN